MLTDIETTEIVAFAAAAGALLALLLALVALGKQRSLRRAHNALRAEDGEPLLEAVRRNGAAVEAMRGEFAALARVVDTLGADFAGSVRHVAVVRYDAFADMGGRLSFSAAWLDDAGDGVVLTSINGRSETRTYAKPIAAGASSRSLSSEENEAIDAALHRVTRADHSGHSGHPGRRRGRAVTRTAG